MIYCYCRISRKEQNIERQVRNCLAEYPEAKVYKEAYTGTSLERPEWKKLMKVVKPGDTIVFDSVSRMSRDAEEGFAAYEELFSRGVELIFLKEPMVNTAVFRNTLSKSIELTGNEIADEFIAATNRVLMIIAKQQIQLAFAQAQKEVDDIHQRTAEGLRTAKLNGKVLGRKTGMTVETNKAKRCKENILKHSKDFGGTLTDVELISLCGISRNSYYKYKHELMHD